MIISALRGNAACFCHGLSFLHKRIFISYCIYIFTLSAKGTTSLSLSTTQSVFTSRRMSSFCAYCSKSGFTHSDGVDTTLQNDNVSSIKLAKESILKPKQEQLLEIQKVASETSTRLPKGYDNARVLLVGDGDLSFAAALSTLKVCKSLTASSWDSKERLIKSFPRAAENIRIIEQNGDEVRYEVDATKLTDCMDMESSFDLIAWNFPHIAGKQNIKRNRELVQNFLMSAFSLMKSQATGMGMVKIALCVGQSGTKAANMDDWNFSWKLIHQAAEAGCLLTDIEEFPLDAFPGYKVTGHRGHGGDFPTGTEPEIFTFRRSALGNSGSVPVASASVLLPSIQNQNQCVNELSTTADIRKDADALSDLPGVSRLVAEHEEGHASNYVAVQAPSYIHEVHLLAVSMVNDLIDLERRAREGVRLIVAQFEEEEERERLLGGVDRAQALDLIRLEKQLLPVRRRYRTQEDRDEMTAAKLALGEIESPAPPLEVFVDSSSRNDSESESNSESEDSIDSSGISVEVDRLHGSGSIFDIASRSVSNFSTGRHASSVWAVNLVDVYTCPRTQQISHAFQVTYCSMTRPIGRTVADTYRKRVERDLPIYLGMVPRVVKHGGLVSLSYPWYVTAAVKSHLAAAALSSANVYSGTGSEIGVVSVGDEGNLIAGGERVDVSDLAAILRELEREEKGRTEKAKAMEIGGDSDHDDSSNCSTSDDVNTTDSDFGAVSDRENIRTIARTLWKKRVGVLMQSTNPSNKV